MRRQSGLHKYVDGIPAIKLRPDIKGCGTCWTCKLRNAARGTGDTRKDATVPVQGISLDFGFITQTSNDLARYEKFLGLNGERLIYSLRITRSTSYWYCYSGQGANPCMDKSLVDAMPPLSGTILLCMHGWWR
jgi:hypothetical protein